MRTAHGLIYISNRHVDRPVLVVPGSNRNGSLVTSKDNRYKHGTMRSWIFSNQILWKFRKKNAMTKSITYWLFPDPVAGHKVPEDMYPITAVFLHCCIINLTVKSVFDKRLWTRPRGSRNQTSYSTVIHDGTSPSGMSPLYDKVKDCQGRLPRRVESIALYNSLWFEKGGLSWWAAREAAHSFNIKSMSPADIWLRR